MSIANSSKSVNKISVTSIDFSVKVLCNSLINLGTMILKVLKTKFFTK